MSSRKQEVPDILGELLGGPRPVAAPQPPAEPVAVPAAPAPAAPVEWEYREVIFRDYRGWRARLVNGVEVGDWKSAPTLVEYLEQAGHEGWELVSMGDRHNNHKEAYFKRPKR